MARQLDDYLSSPPIERREPALLWRCKNCGYWQNRRIELPDHCPICGGTRDLFAEVREE